MNKIVQEALTWLGTPYHPHARIKGAGCDCATFLLEVFNIKDDVGYYSPERHFHSSDEEYLGWLRKFGTEIVDPVEGDVAVFKIGRCFSHGSILVDKKTIIHSHIGQGVVLANISDFENRQVKYFRLGKSWAG